MKEKIKVFLLQNWFKIVIAIFLLVIGFSIFYYFFLRPYQNDRPYRECIKRIDSNANWKDIYNDYEICVEYYK